MRRHPPRRVADPQRQLAVQDAGYVPAAVDTAPLPQTVWVPMLNINGAKAYTPNRMYLAPLKGVIDTFRAGYMLFGLGCGAAANVGHAVYRASFLADRGIVLRRVWREWFAGPKLTEGGDLVSLVLSRTEQYFLAAASDEASPNSHVLAYENATSAYGLRYNYDVTVTSEFPDEIPANHISRDAEFVLGGYCFPASFNSYRGTSGTFNINLFM